MYPTKPAIGAPIATANTAATRSLFVFIDECPSGFPLAGSQAHVICRSLDQRKERLPFFDDIRGELRCIARARVPRRVDRSGRDEQDVAGLERHRRLALDLVLHRTFKDVDDLLARMRVPGERYARGELDAHLDDLASRDAEIVPL